MKHRAYLTLLCLTHLLIFGYIIEKERVAKSELDRTKAKLRADLAFRESAGKRNAISIGMALDEVVSAIGEPDWKEPSSHPLVSESWIYKADLGAYLRVNIKRKTVSYENDKVVGYGIEHGGQLRLLGPPVL